jgi:hypothetical protein
MFMDAGSWKFGIVSLANSMKFGNSHDCSFTGVWQCFECGFAMVMNLNCRFGNVHFLAYCQIPRNSFPAIANLSKQLHTVARLTE